MTKKLYDLDSYVQEFQSVVLSCQPAEKNGRKGFAIALEETCFFPEGGGQPSDTGTLNEIPVLYVYEMEGRVLHLCAQPLDTGCPVTGKLDFSRRFQHMQIHSGEHILSGAALEMTGLINIGFHMGKECNTIDLNGELSAEQVDALEQECNRRICANHPVKVSYPDPDTLNALPLRKRPEVESLRVVEIEGCDACGCCGTHVARTGEIGLLKITDAERYKGGTRLSFLCGMAAFADYQAKHQMVKAIGSALSCKPLEVGGAVERLRQETTNLKIELSQKNKELFALLADKLLLDAEPCQAGKWVFLCREDFSAEDVKAFAVSLSKREGILCTAFSSDATGVRYAVSKSKDAALSLRDFCQAFNQATGGKGGGNGELCCGKLSAPLTGEALRKAVSEALASLTVQK